MFAKLKKKIEDQGSLPAQNKSLQSPNQNVNHNNSSSVFQAPVHHSANTQSYQKRLLTTKSPRTSTSEDVPEDKSFLKSQISAENSQTTRASPTDLHCKSPGRSENLKPDGVIIEHGIAEDEHSRDEGQGDTTTAEQSSNDVHVRDLQTSCSEDRTETERATDQEQSRTVEVCHGELPMHQVTSGSATSEGGTEKALESERLLSELRQELLYMKKKFTDCDAEKREVTKCLETTLAELSDANKLVASLKGQLQDATYDLNKLKEELNGTIDQLKRSSQEKDSLLSKVETLNRDKHELEERIEVVRREREQLETKHFVGVTELQTQVEVAEADRKQLEMKILEVEGKFRDDLRVSLLDAEEQIKDKNKVIKKQEQKLADLRKLVQRELASKQSNTNNSNCNNNSNSALFDMNHHMMDAEEAYFNNSSDVESLGDAVARLNVTAIKRNSHLDFDVSHDLNFKYLKHVILKFFLSREHEALQLIKVVSMLLKFSDDEEKMIRDTLHWRTSWFRTKPHLPEKGQSAIALPALY